MAYYNPPTQGVPRKRPRPRVGLMPNLPAMGPRPMPEFGAIDPMFGVPTNMPSMPAPTGGSTPTRLVGPGMPTFNPNAGAAAVRGMAPTRMIGTGANRMSDTGFGQGMSKGAGMAMNPFPEDLRRRERIRQMALETMARFGR
jgi:hypothetical protein